jgi:hypothetical protein
MMIWCEVGKSIIVHFTDEIAVLTIAMIKGSIIR